MALFIAGLSIFLATHLFTGLARGPRAALQGKLGEAGYKGLYSLASLAGFVLIVMGWPDADRTILYSTPYFLRHIVYALMLIALILLATYGLPKGKIAAAVKHPMLAAVKIWAVAHLLVNGEVRSVILFGSFLAYAVIARIAAKRRGDNGPAPGPAINDAIAVAAGAGLWALIYFLAHPYLAGVALR